MSTIPTMLTPEEQAFLPIWQKCEPYTMTSFERGFALHQAVKHIVSSGISGSFVECGVWRGGSTMIAMLTLLELGAQQREFYLFDTFSGMTAPGQADLDYAGQTAETLLNEAEDAKEDAAIWAYASLENVQSNIGLTGYPESLITFVKGDVRETLPASHLGAIALLRLDTDFYDSTTSELIYLYPKLSEDGILLIDDYGHWQGAKKAVDDYFEEGVQRGEPRPFLQRIDYTGRMAIRPRRALPGIAQRYDYRAPGLVRSTLLDMFPSAIAGNPDAIQWPYLRKEVPHIWRMDARSVRDPYTGILSLEEAELLLNNALAFKGRRGLEIGCHFGWSAAHLLLAGVELDVVDPALSHADQMAAVRDSLSGVETDARAELWAGFSPSVIPAIRRAGAEPWSFAFIDGYHEGDSPRQDAMAVLPHCADDACVMFHDLTSPFVAAGLREFARAGWKVGLLNTMQIMGIAWRGQFEPVRHVADPAAPVPNHSHLADFPLLSVRA